MAHRVCPWWVGYWLACPLRRYGQDPAQTLRPYVHEGMTVLEPGPGMGFFTLELAKLVGPSGRVIAVDIQPQMIQRLKRRAAKAGLLPRIDARVAAADRSGFGDLGARVDFTLAFAVVHELPDPAAFFSAVAAVSGSQGSILLAEPKGHVKLPLFDSEIEAAKGAGFQVMDHPIIRRCNTALLSRC